MRRCSELECLIERSELRLQRLLIIARQRERLDHNAEIMVADSSGGQLDAVADNVVLVGKDLQRVLGLQRLKPSLRHGEGIVGKAELLRLRVKLIHRKVIDIAEAERIFFRQTKLFAQFIPYLSGIVARLILLVGDEENRVSRLKSRQPTQLRLQLLRDELIDWPLVGEILRDLQIAEAAHSEACGEREQLLMEALAHLRMYLDRADTSSHERPEGTFLEEIGEIHDTERVAEIRLIAAKLQHCLSVADHGIRSLCHLRALRCKFCECGGKNLLANPEHILLCRKAHLEIELVKFSGRTVCPRVLVAEAGSDLEILVNAGCHQQLLILLGRLRQCIKLSLIFSGRYNIISRALR